MIWVSLQRERDTEAIVLVADSVEAVKSLQEIFLQVAQTGQRVELAAREGFELDRIRRLVIERNKAVGFLDRSVSLTAKKEHLPSSAGRAPPTLGGIRWSFWSR